MCNIKYNFCKEVVVVVENNKKLDLKESIKNLKMTWEFARKNKKYLFIFLIFNILICVLGVISPMLSAKQILYINDSSWNSLLNISLFILIVAFIKNICRILLRRSSEIFFRKTLLDLQITLANNILMLETEEIDKNSSGLFIDRLNRDTESLADVFNYLIDGLVEIITNIGVMGAIYIVNKFVFIYFVLAIIIMYILNKIRIKQKAIRDKEFRKIREKNTGLIGEMIRGLRDVKVLGSEKNFMNIVNDRLKDSIKKRYEMNKTDRKYQFIYNCVQDIVVFCFILVGIKLVNEKLLTIESLVILYMYQNRVYILLNYTTRVIEYIKNFNVSASRVYEILDETKFQKESFGDITLDKVNGDFEFKNVSFGYENKKNIIKDLSFKINANETVAFVGRSGGGKSTIFSLLTKLYHPKKGNIYIDGINIDNLSKETIRNNISIITQNPYIFNFSIKENLKIVKADATDKEIIEACKKASLHKFIMSLPDKYDTLVGEGGVTLSGGQRQRLAIARAFIKNSEIMLFDEATSALDNETQSDIQDAINKMKNKNTVLIIAHRLSTVINSDRILVVDNGQIVGEGTHKELLKTNELYKELYTSELKK
jgi:ABC-type multidrug transport system fused ATPase/permease subunit